MSHNTSMAVMSEWECLGHRMTLTADGKALTGCRWAVGGRKDLNGSPEGEGHTVIGMAVAQIAEYLEGKRKEFSVPIRIGGTEFRMKVWDEMRRIPYGETVTYKELARRIGSPDACRAVANACGANPFPILIPCHRVVACGGRSGGV